MYQRCEGAERGERQGDGRQPTDAEINYWLPRKEHYRLMIGASRSYLYSPAGAKDSVETVKRALSANSGRPAGAVIFFKDETVKEALMRLPPPKPFTSKRQLTIFVFAPKIIAFIIRTKRAATKN